MGVKVYTIDRPYYKFIFVLMSFDFNFKVIFGQVQMSLLDDMRYKRIKY